jgi:hypothetical protein
MYDYNEFTNDVSGILDLALSEDVVIQSKDGIDYKLTPVKENITGKSPFEGIKGIKANVTTQELVEIIREGRAGI